MSRRQAFGQHFLRDETVICAIVDSFFDELAEQADRGSFDCLEIGPGRGALTHVVFRRLAELDSARFPPSKLKLVEMDRKLSQYWREQAPACFIPCEIIDEDFLKLGPQDFLPQDPTRSCLVFSNLPYSSGTAILTTLAQHPDRIPAMVLMFQKEVAERLRAEPRSKAWGSLSLWIQTFWEVQSCLKVSPRAFSPPPKVWSEVVLLKPRANPLLNLDHPRSEAAALWQELLRLAFAHRRKMLRSSLPKGSRFQRALENTSIDGTTRAEALSWEQWAEWFAACSQIK